jgi:hypothetical protein
VGAVVQSPYEVAVGLAAQCPLLSAEMYSPIS